jgi:hypothetical protein
MAIKKGFGKWGRVGKPLDGYAYTPKLCESASDRSFA